MTQEERNLLLKDLCTRLAFGRVKCQIKVESFNEEMDEDIELFDDEIIFIEPGIYNVYLYEEGTDVDISDIKPYLRPMSSMTEEEKEKLKQEHIKDEKLYAECLTKAANGDDSMRGKVIPHFAADWCNKNHFDYRGLIPIGLALEAPEGMYKNY